MKKKLTMFTTALTLVAAAGGPRHGFQAARAENGI